MFQESDHPRIFRKKTLNNLLFYITQSHITASGILFHINDSQWK